MTADDKLIFGVLFTVAVMCFALSLWIRRRESAPRLWPQAPGVIVASATQRQYAGNGVDEIFPTIEYKFEYLGRSYITKHWRLGNFTPGDSTGASEVAARYPVGAPVTVLVNARRPVKSVLEASPSALCWVPFAFGLLFLAIVVIGIWSASRSHTG